MTDQAQEQSVEERMLAYVEAEEGLTEEEQPEEQVEAVEEEVEEESEEDQSPATVILKFNGEEIEKPLEEVVTLAQQGLDYTQKTQKLAEERRIVEAQVQAVKAQEQQFQQQVQVQQALIQEIAQLTAIDQQLAQYSQVNWQALSDQDPVEAQKLFFTYSQLNTQRQQMMMDLGGKQQQLQQQQQQRFQQALQEGMQRIATEIPGWGEETRQELVTVGKQYGFSDEELSSIVDPRHIKVLWEAAQWRKLQNNPTANKKVTAAPPVVKPGSKDKKTVQNSQSRQLHEQLKKTGKDEYARQLIERML